MLNEITLAIEYPYVEHEYVNRKLRCIRPTEERPYIFAAQIKRIKDNFGKVNVHIHFIGKVSGFVNTFMNLLALETVNLMVNADTPGERRRALKHIEKRVREFYEGKVVKVEREEFKISDNPETWILNLFAY
ncbi:MAG: hypothetical protein QXU69_08540 [Thermofilaceae archaeon]